jgi:hypothetical protein
MTVAAIAVICLLLIGAGLSLMASGVLLVLKESSLFELLANRPLLLLSGAFFFVDLLPQPFHLLAMVNPITYVIGIFRGSLMGLPTVVSPTIGIMSCTVIALLIMGGGIVTYHRMLMRSLRQGTLGTSSTGLYIYWWPTVVREVRMIDVIGLRKIYTINDRTRRFRLFGHQPTRSLVALDELNLHIQQGEFYSLLGPNGAGKTTLIKILCTLLLPDAGRCRVADCDVVRTRDAHGCTLGLDPRRAGVYWKLTGRQNLGLSNLYGMYGRAARQRVTDIGDIIDSVIVSTITSSGIRWA